MQAKFYNLLIAINIALIAACIGSSLVLIYIGVLLSDFREISTLGSCYAIVGDFAKMKLADGFCSIENSGFVVGQTYLLMWTKPSELCGTFATEIDKLKELVIPLIFVIGVSLVTMIFVVLVYCKSYTKVARPNITVTINSAAAAAAA